jgi:hypothetical protein
METPVYSIKNWNESKGYKDHNVLVEQDENLSKQIYTLVSVNMMIQYSAEKPTLTKSVYCDCLVHVTITETFPAISFGLF